MLIPQLCNLGLSGMSFVGTDIGCFGSDCTKELMCRWVEAGCFSPLFRNHTALNTRNQEAWQFDQKTLDIYKKYTNLRYKLIPYCYDLFSQREKDGQPIMRPLIYHYVKAGSILPIYPKQSYVGEKDVDKTLMLEIFLGEGSISHFQDNGEDFAYREGAYNEYRLEQKDGNLTITLTHRGYEKVYEKVQVICMAGLMKCRLKQCVHRRLHEQIVFS